MPDDEPLPAVEGNSVHVDSRALNFPRIRHTHGPNGGATEGMTRVLFVTWDGPDQAYLESLFLPIFRRLGEVGFTFDVLQYTWAPAAALSAARRACAAANVGYLGRPAMRRWGAAGVAATIAMGANELARCAGRYDLILARSLLPAAMVCASPAARARLVFDADGLAADERLESAQETGIRPFYGLHREIERAALTSARAVITRTHAAKEILLSRAGPGLPAERVHVIPNGSDEQRFAPASHAQRMAIRRSRGMPDAAPWFVTVGSLGSQYLPELQFDLFRALAEVHPAARFSVLTGRPAWVESGWRRGLGQALDVRRVPPAEVAEILSAADLGLALRRPSFSQRAVSPIKIGEYLLSGVPVVATHGVGDLDADLGSEPEAALLIEPDAAQLAHAAEWALDRATTRRERARDAARHLGLRRFSLAQCVTGYADALSAGLEG